MLHISRRPSPLGGKESNQPSMTIIVSGLNYSVTPILRGLAETLGLDSLPHRPPIADQHGLPVVQDWKSCTTVEPSENVQVICTLAPQTHFWY
jgi:hypothetical protein